MTTIYVHNGDIGTIFRLKILHPNDVDTYGELAGTPIDVSTATVKYINFQDPSGVRMQKTAAFDTDGTDGKIQYTSVSGDIDSVGTWQIQGYVETSLGKFWTEKDSFKVYSTLATA